ncbi:MAG: DNA methyltransferase, partial [Patescibacteria group bacterium]|nr:DNA methyltransferase [Patescibacteria group bacterium]
LLLLASSHNSIILDFFAGSGTTGHAVMELNKEDGGNRKFILCSNQESTPEAPEKNICRDITYERNKRVIEGYTDSKGKEVEGLGGNLNYYTTEFIKTEKSTDDLRMKFIHRCDEILCIKEDTFKKVALKTDIKSLHLYERTDTYTAILYDVLDFESLKKLLGVLNKPVSVYVFSLAENEIFYKEIEDIDRDIQIRTIPSEILQVYKKIFNF